ncbi:MAG: hypothetical protein H7644_06945 [Candidatus Heimdallarchaeota archaeon]|nr:hypothetical protein [Candidatus Heimdallarchaeota archaeon]MCK5143486.1 hypothetical protein [Candidatus Heimdallarchaeota archaeon]
MEPEDIIDKNFKQEAVILIKDEAKLQIMGNPVYYPIFMSLRDGHKTVKEIEEDYTKLLQKQAKKKGAKSKKEVKEFVEKNKRSGKSLYRYIQHLIDAGFVALVGKRVSIDNPMTEKLFARTATFFFVESFYEKIFCTNPNCMESMTQLLELIYDVPKPETADLEQFTSSMMDSSKKITSKLFNEKSEEFVQMVDKLSLDEITAVLQTLSLIDLVSKPENYARLLKNLKK